MRTRGDCRPSLRYAGGMNTRQNTPVLLPVALGCLLIFIVVGVLAFLGFGFFAFQTAPTIVQSVPAEVATSPSVTEELTIDDSGTIGFLTWNVESGGNDPETIARQLSKLSGYAIYGLCEVAPENAEIYRRSISVLLESVMSETGHSDRLMFIYNRFRVEMVASEELHEFDGVQRNDENRNHRSPLVAEFKDKITSDQFKVVLVHLARGNAELRQHQALGLRKWAEAQTLPVFAIGDFNFDYDFPTQKGNKAFDIFTEGDTWQWVKPDPLVDTNWSDPDGDGMDNYPDTCRDFIFVANAKEEWTLESTVIVRDGDFPDDDRTSDHRPVEVVIQRQEAAP